MWRTLSKEDENMLLAFVIFTTNLFSFALMGADKAAAKAGRRRLPERILLLIALCNGGVGCTIGMFYYHHKTKHKQFLYILPLIAIAQAVFFALCFIL